MAKKKEFVIRFKYPDQPWIEWARTSVESIVTHYEQGAKLENPGATVYTFKE